MKNLDLAIQFLPPEPRILVAREHAFQERWRKMPGVGLRRRARDTAHDNEHLDGDGECQPDGVEWRCGVGQTLLCGDRRKAGGAFA